MPTNSENHCTNLAAGSVFSSDLIPLAVKEQVELGAASLSLYFAETKSDKDTLFSYTNRL